MSQNLRVHTSQVAECLPLAQSENCSSMSSFEYRDRHLSLSTRETLKIANSRMVFNYRPSLIFSQQKFELSIINENTSPLPLEGCLLCAYCQSFPILGKKIFHSFISYLYNQEDQMMATCRAHPPYTKAVVLSGKTSPVCGRHTGGNL